MVMEKHGCWYITLEGPLILFWGSLGRLYSGWWVSIVYWRNFKIFNMSMKDCCLRQARPKVDSYAEEFGLFLRAIGGSWLIWRWVVIQSTLCFGKITLAAVWRIGWLEEGISETRTLFWRLLEASLVRDDRGHWR